MLRTEYQSCTIVLQQAKKPGFTAPFNNVRTLKFKARSSDKCVFCYNETNVQWLLPASDYCRAHGNQIK